MQPIPQSRAGNPGHSVSPAAPAGAAAPAIRVSDRERDEVIAVLQTAFADGYLDDEEFDGRTRSALTARTRGDLDALTTDLPALPAGQPAAAPPAGPGRAPGKYALSYKGSVRRAGRWRVPGTFRSVVYKGSGLIDLRAAELTETETTLTVIAYKSRVDVLVPPGVRAELDGFGVSKGWSEQEELEVRRPSHAPVVRIRGLAYKGTVEVSSHPPAGDPSGR